MKGGVGLQSGNLFDYLNKGIYHLPGSIVFPMARAFGARVITTVLNDEFAKYIQHLRADRVVVTSHEDLSEDMLEEKAAGHGVDICIIPQF